jgi:pathogenesis-related protein 1
MDIISTHPATPSDHAATEKTEETGAMQGMTATHNRIRARLGLPALHWSERLAAIASKRAAYLAEHNNCEMRHTKSEYGENIFWASPVKWSDGRREVQKINAEHVAEAWAAEAADYDYRTNTCRSGAMCGHYTQMVWKDTRELGCGIAVCADKAQIWLCVYNPPGNYVGIRPY